MVEYSGNPPTQVSPAGSHALRTADSAVERSRVVGDAYDRYMRTADGTEYIGDGTIAPTSMGESIEPSFITSTSPFAAAVANVAIRQIRGYDPVDAVAWLVSSATIYQGTNPSAAISTAKGAPAAVVDVNTVKKMVRFKDKVYLIGLDASDGLYKIWRADPAAGNTVFSWSAALLTLSVNGTAIGPAMNADASYIYVGEYSGATGPTGGPKIYRSADGVTWETIHQIPAAGAKHMHAVIPDPYFPGHVYASAGDGLTTSFLRSTDYGTTWTTLGNSAWQGVQISFNAEYVWVAGDSAVGTVFVYDRATGVNRWAASNFHHNIAVPGGAAADRFFINAFYGIVDPATGVYYCTTQSDGGAGNRYGLFYLPRAGGQIELLEAMTVAISGEMFIFGGRVWWFGYSRPLITLA